MTRSIQATILILLLFTAMACKRRVVEGQGGVTSESRTVPAFSKVEIKTPIDAVIRLEAHSQPSCSIKGYANLVSNIKTEVKDNTLIIFTDELFHFNTDKDLVATITLPAITDLVIKGASDVEMQGAITGPVFNLAIKGAGDVVVNNIQVDKFTTELAGSGDVEIRGGNVNYASYKVAGAGDISSFPLQCKVATVSIAGVGDVELSVSDKLDARVAGAGAVNYKGNPQLTTKITGAGAVEQAK